MFRLPDGRLFVTDGALTLDAELAKPRVLPDASLRFGGDLEPVVIVAGGKAVGLVMATAFIGQPAGSRYTPWVGSY